MKTLRTIDIDRWSGRLPALALAGALSLMTISPAFADFESAVAAYEDGAYREAQTEFEALAADGDERSAPYLERIREKLRDGQQAGWAVTSTLMDSITSIFGESDAANDGSPSSATSSNTGSSAAARSPAAAPGKESSNWEPWSPFDSGTEPAPLPVSDVAIPQHRSIWSTVFHLPGDATVIGLQYVALFLDADNLSRELRLMSRHSDKIALSILAGFWWLVIIKCLVGIVAAIGRLMKVAATIEGQKRYG